MANIIRLDKVKGYPVSFYNSIENLENGAFLELKGLKKDSHQVLDDREAYDVVAATDSSTGTVVLHASVPVMYDERLIETDFTLAAGKIGRAYILERGDIVTIGESFGTGAIAVGDAVGLDATGKLSKAATNKIFEVIAKERFSGQPSLVIQYL